MRLLCMIATLLAVFCLTSMPAYAQAVPLSREFPMGERTTLFAKYPYENSKKNIHFNYYLMGPKDIQKGAKYPLIVVLHGKSGHAYGAYVLADQIANQGMPAFVIVPAVNEYVRGWTEAEYEKKDPENPMPIDQVAILTRFITSQFPIDPSKIYVTGYSMGGVGAFGALYYHPELFAAAIPICGGWYPQDAAKFVGKPLWAFHGAADSVVPVRQTRDMIAAIRAQGGDPQYTEYAGVDHNSWLKAYAEPQLWTWLFSQSLGKPH
jgi:predicted peptidase